MKLIKKYLSLFIISTLLILVSQTQKLQAEEAKADEYKTMEQMMGAIRLEKKQVESMLDKMVTSGRISKDEAVLAKRELASMKESDLDNLKNSAISQIKK